MVRKGIQIKRIDNTITRQVTFSKRKRGVFKKAEELSVLCDAEVALITFSATGKLFEYCSSSMLDVINRHQMYSEEPGKQDKYPFRGLQVETRSHAMLVEEMNQRTSELRHLQGEELEGHGIEELTRLERATRAAINRVSKVKGEKLVKEIGSMKKKEALLRAENAKLKLESEKEASNAESSTNAVNLGNSSDQFLTAGTDQTRTDGNNDVPEANLNCSNALLNMMRI